MQTNIDWEDVVLDGMLETRKRLSGDAAFDENSTHIFNHIKEHRDKLSFETVFEALVQCGLAPALVYDDNGKFAISECGMTPFYKVGTKIQAGQEMVGFVAEDDNLWHGTVRDALNAFIDRL
jgi:hypothetical protein